MEKGSSSNANGFENTLTGKKQVHEHIFVSNFVTPVDVLVGNREHYTKN